jgi:hypothetical protein
MENKLLLTKTALKWSNEYYEKEDYILLKVFRKDLTEFYDVLIDKEDFKLVSQGQWYGYMNRKNTYLKNLVKILYTIHDPKKKTYDIHQWILQSKGKDLIVDHKNLNRLDNRRCNLRFVTAQENRLNQVCTGWSYHKEEDVYKSNIYYNNKCFYLGEYKTKEEAEEIYLKSCLITGYNKTSDYHNDEIKRLHIQLNKLDYENLYLKELINYKDNGILEYIPKITILNQENSKGANNLGLGYNYDKKTGKYLARIKLNDKELNIGRYNTEDEANIIYLKACLMAEKEKISPQIAERINKYNIKLTGEDYKNKYLKKVYNCINNIDESIENGRFNYKYDENIDIIINMVNKGFTWNGVARYLKENIKGLEKAKGETIKKKYMNYISAERNMTIEL